MLFRGNLAALLGRADTVSVTSPLGGVTIAARVVGLLAAADRGRGAAAMPASAPPSDEVLWIDDRPDGGQAERAALRAVGIGTALLGRPEEAAGRHARVAVLAGRYAADGLGNAPAPATALLVLYPAAANGVVSVQQEATVTVCRDAASLFVTIASRFG